MKQMFKFFVKPQDNATETFNKLIQFSSGHGFVSDTGKFLSGWKMNPVLLEQREIRRKLGQYLTNPSKLDYNPMLD